MYIYFKSFLTYSSNYFTLVEVAKNEGKKIVSRNEKCGMRKREFLAHECKREANDSDWRQYRGKRRKIICTASLLADPISGSTMNRDRRSKYAFYPTGTRDPFYGGYESRAIRALTRTVFLWIFKPRSFLFKQS